MAGGFIVGDWRSSLGAKLVTAEKGDFIQLFFIDLSTHCDSL